MPTLTFLVPLRSSLHYQSKVWIFVLLSVATNAANSAPSGWSVKTVVDQFTDKTTVRAQLPAFKKQVSPAPTLNFNCVNGEPQFYIDYGLPTPLRGNNAEVLLRFDKNKAYKDIWFISRSTGGVKPKKRMAHEALTEYPENRTYYQELFGRLYKAKVLLVKLTAIRACPICSNFVTDPDTTVAFFDISKLKEAIQPAVKACNWYIGETQSSLSQEDSTDDGAIATDSGELREKRVAARQAAKSRDYETAFQLYEELAKKGDPESQYVLANMYINGKGVNKNESKGITLVGESAANGYPDAQYHFGLLVKTGAGSIPRSRANAKEWFIKAARQGHRKAQRQLRKHYGIQIR